MRIVLVSDMLLSSDTVREFAAETQDLCVITGEPVPQSKKLNSVIYVTGNSAAVTTLMEAGVPRCDVFVAFGASDEINMLSCIAAKRVGAKYTVAKIKDPEYYRQMDFLGENLCIDMVINPDNEVAEEIARIIILPPVCGVDVFAGGKFELVEYVIPRKSPLDLISLRELYAEYNIRLLVCAVSRGDKLFIPDGSFVLNSGDKISVSASHENLEQFFRVIGAYRSDVRDVVIFGGGLESFYLSRQLLKLNIGVRIFERDAGRCAELEESLPGVSVKSGEDFIDRASPEMITSEIKDIGAFISLTDDDEDNMIMAFYAKAAGVPKVVTKIDRAAYARSVRFIGLDSAVSSSLVVQNAVLGFIRARKNTRDSRVDMLYRFMDGRAEALQITATAGDAPYIGVPLKDLPLKKDLLIAGIIRNGEAIIPGGNDCILCGDSVIVMTGDRDFTDLYDIMNGKSGRAES